MRILVTGAAGFIGYHLCLNLIARGDEVIGVDNLNDYYSVKLKNDRLKNLKKKERFTFESVDVADYSALKNIRRLGEVNCIVHLAAQAGVRYSIENPHAYVKSNLCGHSNILELSRHLKINNTVYASSSSVYGGNTKIPFSEIDRTDNPVSFYAATKKSNELLSESYASLYNISLTGLRFFTVYGPWGRPDMAYWSFTKKLSKNEPIDIFNFGKMGRDFTYIDDIIKGIISAIERPASLLGLEVPHRVYNLGNDKPEELMDMIGFIEEAYGKSFKKNFMPMQSGDVIRTWANISRAKTELGYQPTVSLQNGIEEFIQWYRSYNNRT